MIPISRSELTNGYAVELHHKSEKVIAKCYYSGMRIGKCTLDGLNPRGLWTYELLPQLARSKIDQILSQQEVLKWSRTITVEKANERNNLRQEQDSDEELSEQSDTSLFIFQKQIPVPVIATTVSCLDENIKGSALIEIVHETIRDWYCGAIDEVSEKGTLISPPRLRNGVLFIDAPVDWFFSLGGWKGMMPSEEVQSYLFKEGTKFRGIAIYNNEITFPITEERIHLPKNFSINQIDITGFWEKQEKGWVKFPSGKTDLSYPQILFAIDTLKKEFKLDDSKIATIQLWALSRENFPLDSAEMLKLIPKNNQREVLQFLDYFNAVMFGMEASGLNAALATGVMTLDLIAKKMLGYAEAFKANKDGGVYPHACFGNNKGTYSEREKILLYKKKNCDSCSMKAFRENPSLSPVATKEAVLIKYWLSCNKLLLGTDHTTQKVAIKKAVRDLIMRHFSP